MKAGVLTAGALAIHNFPEGFATFIAALEDPAIAVHNIPEGIAVAVPIRVATGSRAKASGWRLIPDWRSHSARSSDSWCSCPSSARRLMGISYVAVAGIMVFVSLDELLPIAQATGKHHHAVYGLILGMAVMAVSLLMLG